MITVKSIEGDFDRFEGVYHNVDELCHIIENDPQEHLGWIQKCHGVVKITKCERIDGRRVLSKTGLLVCEGEPVYNW